MPYFCLSSKVSLLLSDNFPIYCKLFYFDHASCLLTTPLAPAGGYAFSEHDHTINGKVGTLGMVCEAPSVYCIPCC